MAGRFARRLLMLSGLLGVAAGVAHVDADEVTRFTHVRGLSAEMRRLIREADAASETFRGLVDEIQRSNTIVFLQLGPCQKGRIRSCVCDIGGDLRRRHIRILIDPRTTEDRLEATIAHELHHALEIIREPEVTDARRALVLYRRIGKGDCGKGLSDICETEAALALESQVLKELHQALKR